MFRLRTLFLPLLFCLGACAPVSYDLPPLAGGSDRLPGKVVWHDLITDTPAASERFYGELFDWTFEPVPGVNYTLIRHDGRAIGGLVDQGRLPVEEDVSQWVALLAVDDIEAAAAGVGPAGGRLLTPPTSLGRRGRVAVAADPEGAVFALLETGDGDPPDGAQPPAPGGFLWDELWAVDTAGAAAFYRRLLPYEGETLALAGDLDYTLLSAAGRPRAGIRPHPLADSAPLWVNYLRVADLAALEAILARVEGLGGRVLQAATARPAGGYLAVVQGPSGAGIALQTWPLEPARESSP
jgi:predicted enzyme related to lactoylglutathione lyase